MAVGRIGERVLRRLQPFGCKELLYYDYQPLKPEVEKPDWPALGGVVWIWDFCLFCRGGWVEYLFFNCAGS